jgi:hypothetical protein
MEKRETGGVEYCGSLPGTWKLTKFIRDSSRHLGVGGRPQVPKALDGLEEKDVSHG